MPNQKPRLLTGDTPSGRLHLGHWVGSVENRVMLQDEYDCNFIIADMHAFTTKADKPKEIHDSVMGITLDYLAAGIDPSKSNIFCESAIPAIYELASIFSMIIPFPRLMRNPTIKDEIRDKQLGDNYSFGFMLYPVLQVADILSVRADIVPVGEDQIPHLEMTRGVARKFNQQYCGVNSHLPDEEHLANGGLFPIVNFKMGRQKRLIGLNGPNKEGKFLKMSKSLNNAILLSDDMDIVRKKVMGMYTDPKRLKATDPGTVENNPLWIFHDTFNEDKTWVEETKERYRAGTVGDVECKKKLVEVMEHLLKPMSERYKVYGDDLTEVKKILQDGNAKVNAAANETLKLVKEKIHL